MDDPNLAIWREIERSESYLVCGMYEEAASLASSILKQVREEKCSGTGEHILLHELMESAGMVLVQSWKELGRSPNMLDELKSKFGTITDIPVSVFLSSSCFQLAEGAASGVQEFLLAFLSKWRYVDEQHYTLVDEAKVNYEEGCIGHCILGAEKYLEVVDAYFTLLVMVMKDMDLAYSWVEKAPLPEEKRQQLVRRFHSISSSEANNSSNSCDLTIRADDHQASSSLVKANISDGHLKFLEDPANGRYNRKQAFLNLCRRLNSYFWWFRAITFRFGATQLVLSSGKVVLSCMVLVIYYMVRSKQATLKRIFKRQAMSMRKGLVDLWQLAFSFQVNPLAAVQPHAAMASGTR